MREVNDLGISYYQWNCAYNPNDTSLWTDRLVSQDVIWWTELAPMPNLQMQQQPTAEGAEDIIRKNCHTCFSRSTGQEEVWTSLESVIIAIHEFATIHAQRIAEKMVADKLRDELVMFGSYFNNLDPKDHILVKDIDEYLKSKEQ